MDDVGKDKKPAEVQLNLRMPGGAKSAAPAPLKVRAPGKSKLAKRNTRSTGQGGIQVPLRLTRDEGDMLEALITRYREKYHKVNRSSVLRAAVHLLASDTRSRNLLLKLMKEEL